MKSDLLFIYPSVMKTLTSCIILLVIFCSSSLLRAQSSETAERVDSILLGNCNKSIVVYENIYSDNQTGGSALYYPESTMQMFKDCRIKDIYLGVASYKNLKSLQIFITHQLEAPYDYVQSVQPTKTNWNRIVLDKPFALDGRPIYIGYIIEGATMLCYTNAKEKNEEWINQRDNQWSKYTNLYSAALYAVVEGGDKLPQHNVRLKNVKMPAYTLTDTPMPFEGDISNLGAETVHALEFTYQAGGKEYKEVLEDLNIKSHSETHFQIDGLKIAEEGDFDLTLTVTAINGQPDQDMTDNQSRTVPLLCRKEFTERKILLEVFSTELCSSCPSAHKFLSKELDGDHRVIELGHHSGFLEDPLTIPASRAYTWFYKPDRQHAPAMMWDRTNMYDNYPEYYEAETPIVAVQEKPFATLFANALKAPAFATVHLSVEKSSTGTRNIDIHVDGKQLLPIPENGDDRLFVFLTEDSIFSANQSGSNRNFYHRHVTRQCVTDTWGDAIQIANGYAADYTVKIPESWNTEQMHVIAFVGNYDAEDRNNCRIYNAETFSLKSLLPTGIYDRPFTEEIQIIRNGCDITIPDGYDVIKLYTPEGQCVLNDAESKRHISLERFPKGIYMLSVSCGSKQRILKISL